MATINGTKSADSLDGTEGADTINAGNGGDAVSGLDGDDRIDGGAGADGLDGGDDDDRILGGGGDDVISGGDDEGDGSIGLAGSTLTAFDTGDVLTGGGGSDRFIFAGFDDDHDLVTDFRRGTDTLEISDDADVEQVVVTGGVLGRGLLVVTEGDNGLFLKGVTAPLVEGEDLVFV